MRPLFALFALFAATSAGAQSLPYADVLRPSASDAAPRLVYAELAIAEAPPPARRVESSGLIHGFYGDRFEISPKDNGYSWDVSAEIGSAAHRLWLSTSGDGGFHGGLSYVELQALYSHPVTDSGLALQAGIRRDLVRPRRTYAVLGAQGNLTEPFYVGAFGFLSTRGELTARAFAYYDSEFAPRLILQPYADAELAAQDVPALGLGAGLTEADLGLRLRYRIAEPFSPYLGLSWDRLVGRTARIARQAGDDPGGAALVMGVRSYF